MQHHLVAHGHVFADHHGKAAVGVQDAAILNIAALTDVNLFGVAANHHVKPDANIGLKHHIADQGRIVGYKMAFTFQSNLAVT